jgi:hypothetical protein
MGSRKLMAGACLERAAAGNPAGVGGEDYSQRFIARNGNTSACSMHRRQHLGASLRSMPVCPKNSTAGRSGSLMPLVQLC